MLNNASILPMSGLPEGQGFPATLVLGATGRLGSMLRRNWPSDWPVTWAAREARAPDIVACDPLALAPAALLETIAEVDLVICLAGSVPRRGDDDGAAMLDAHVALGRALAEAAAKVKTPLLIASSSAVYGGSGAGRRLRESDPLPTHVSSYAAAKQAMEAAVLKAGGQATCLRICNIAGADALLEPFNDEAVLSLKETSPPCLDNFAESGRPRGPERCYLGPVSFARILASLALRAAEQTRVRAQLPACLNVSGPGCVDMAALLAEAEIPFEWRPAGADSIARVELDVASLGQHMTLSENLSDPARIIAEWREYLAHRAP
ncbi:MAG: NAD-dependent epimerase/dehydratase family protein [Pseudomonadota bacterium]